MEAFNPRLAASNTQAEAADLVCAYCPTTSAGWKSSISVITCPAGSSGMACTELTYTSFFAP